MTLRSVILLCCLVLPCLSSGCGESPAGGPGLEGTWIVDGPKSKAALQAAAAALPGGTDPRRAESIYKGIDNVVDRTVNSPFHMVFQSGGKFLGVSPTGQEGRGTWSLDAATGVVTMTPEKPGEAAITARLQDGELRVKDEKGRPVFVMVKGTPKSK